MKGFRCVLCKLEMESRHKTLAYRHVVKVEVE